MGVAVRMIQADKGEISPQDFSQLKTDSGQNTVPNVWVGEKHVGGCDHTMAARKNGKLVAALEHAGITHSAKL